MAITTITLNRENLVNKCDAHYIDGEILIINGLRSYFKEAIAQEDGEYTAVHIFDANGNELTEGSTGDYILNEYGAYIDFNSSPIAAPYKAYYYGVGSIIWAEDVNELQTAVKQINTAGFAKDGSVAMTGNLDIGNNNITNVGTINGINLGSHNHSNGQGDLIPADGLASNSVTTAKIVDNSVTTDKILNSAVTTDKLNDASVTTAKLADSNIVTSKLADYTVTTDKIASAVFTTLLNNLYPLYSIYITTNDTCPIETIYHVGTWVKVSSGRVLQGADTSHAAGTTIEAGLPNITGNLTIVGAKFINSNEALYVSNTSVNSWTDSHDREGKDRIINIDASRSNSIYGNNETVQPPAYVVNIFRRIG